jgi:hypothetical protein
MSYGRIVGAIAALILFIGAAVFFFFRYSFSAEGLYRVQTALGMNAPLPERHVVPEDFRGWAVLHFGVEGAPPLSLDGETLVVEYPSSGRLETSTPPSGDEGFAHREYFRFTAQGLAPLSRMGEIWGEYNMRVVTDDQGAVSGRSTGFFVGTLAEFRAAERPRTGFEPPELPTLQE